MQNTDILQNKIQSNLIIPTPGFHVTPLIMSIFQSLDFLYMILMQINSGFYAIK